MQERKTNHTLLYLACEHMMFGVRKSLDSSKERTGSNNPRKNGAQRLDNQ